MPSKQQKKKTKARKAKNATVQNKVQKVKTTQFLQPKKYSARRPQPARSEKINTHGATCSTLDPFCPHARNSKFPDGGPPSLPLQLRGLFSYNALGTAGANLKQIVANPVYPILESTKPASVWVMDSASGVGPIANTFFTDNAAEVRINSWGVIVRSQMTASTAKGSVILTTITSPNYSDSLTVGAMQGAEVQTHSIAATSEIAWFSKRIGPEANLFKPLSHYTSSQKDLNWTNLQIEVVGGDTTSNIPMLSLEIVFNIEFTVGKANGLQQAQTEGRKSNPIAIQASKQVSTTVDSFISGGIDMLGAKISQAAATSLESVMSEGFALLGLL